MFSFIWWIIGFYWVSTGGQSLTDESPQLYWLCVTLLAFDVFFLSFVLLWLVPLDLLFAAVYHVLLQSYMQLQIRKKLVRKTSRYALGISFGKLAILISITVKSKDPMEES